MPRDNEIYKLWGVLESQGMLETVLTSEPTEIERLMIELDQFHNNGLCLRETRREYEADVDHYAQTERWLVNGKGVQ